MERFLSNCSQMKIIVTIDSDMLRGHHIPEAVTVYAPNYLQEFNLDDEIANIFRRHWQHKDVLSMLKEWARRHASPRSFKITSTLSSRVMFKKLE